MSAGCLAALAACGGGSADGPVAQPAPGVTAFVSGDFDDLPLVPGSEPFGERSEKDGVTTQTFKVRGYTAEAVIEFYAGALPSSGWRQVAPAFREDTSTRSDWVTDGWRLEISAFGIADGSQDDGGGEEVVQYSLVLRPR